MEPGVTLDRFIASLPPGATLVGRMDRGDGPTPVILRDGDLFDVSAIAPTVADLLARPDLSGATGIPSGRWSDLGHGAIWRGATPRLLAPIDLHCIKAAGVTFAESAIERVIEERARGEQETASLIRQSLSSRIGSDIVKVVPGTEASRALKTELLADGLWSQYLEVAIGPDAEIFTKAPTLSAVGDGAMIGIRSDSAWNNPEPEIVLVCNPQGFAVGATLGNDVNLRDIEGRSALLLGKAKDNNGSCAIGPFIRLFDDTFTLDTVRHAEVFLEVIGTDGFVLSGSSSMTKISRDPLELVNQTIGRHHQYPDGFALFLGTMFAPTKDRAALGKGFTHHPGDIVRIFSPELGSLENIVAYCEDVPPWTFGVSSLMRNLACRGLLMA